MNKENKEHEDELNKWQKENHMKFIFTTSDIKDIIEIMQTHPEQYLILTPIEEEALTKIFENLKSKFRRIAIIAKLAHTEDKRIYIKDLNYIISSDYETSRTCQTQYNYYANSSFALSYNNINDTILSLAKKLI